MTARARPSTQLRHLTTRDARRGAVLVEFAFVALAFYLLLAGTLELGRMITTSQVIQNAARVGARELALVSLPATATFEQALADPEVRARVYDPRFLAVDVTAEPAAVETWPALNRMLYPLMIRERVDVGGAQRDILRYPGALVQDGGGALSVVIPQIVGRDADGVERVRFSAVVEEVIPDPADPASAPFSIASTGPQRGVVALRVHAPYQATTLTAYRVDTATNVPIVADDANVSVESAPPGELVAPSSDSGAYSGRYGLGKWYAVGAAGASGVRPFRRLFVAQGLFRREVFD